MAEANAVVARTAYEMALSGRFPAVTFFWEKCNARRVEKVEEEESSKPYKVEIRFPGKESVLENETTNGTA